MSSDDESSESSTDASDNPAEVVADSPNQQDESLTSSGRPVVMSLNRPAVAETDYLLRSIAGVTNVPKMNQK